MTSELNNIDKSQINGQKRKLDEDQLSVRDKEKNTSNSGSKRVVQDGFSWWTCLSMGMSVEKSRPHAFPKQPNS